MLALSTRNRRLLALLCPLLVCAVPVPAAHASPDGAQSDDAASRQRRARVLYEEGLEEYGRSAFARAIELFQAALDLYPSPALHFNIGQAYQQLGDCRRALEHYRQSSSDGATAAYRSRLEARIAEMESCLAGQEPAAIDPASTPSTTQAPTPAPAPVEAARDRPDAPRRRGPLLLGIGGGVAVVGAAGVLTWVHFDLEDLADRCMHQCAPSATDDLERRALVGYVLLGVGAAAVVTSLVWWRLGKPSRTDGISLVPTGRGIALGGSF